MNLAFTLRPQNLAEFVGQHHLIGEGKIIRKMIESDNLFSMILWGPPGSGKTTLAHIISKETKSDFHILSGVTSGKADLLKVIEIAKQNRDLPILPSPGEERARVRSVSENQNKDRRTILFIDEIHRWNKAQQDTLLPHVESGLLTLIGATTENPSFEVISALLSRSRIFVLKPLEKEELSHLIQKALTDKERGLGKYKQSITADAEDLLIRFSGGDARTMLNALEIAVTNYSSSVVSTKSRSKKEQSSPPLSNVAGQGRTITAEIIKEVFQTKSAGLYDKKADEHYNIISAFIKSMRGSDVDAALYYLARMLENGEDPKFIARRMIIFCSEDIGMADRGALIQANAGFEAVTKIGMPEAQLILAHIVIYLSTAKKSRAVANALERAKAAVYELPNEPIPLHIRNAPTKLMKDLGYGKQYEWSTNHVGPTEKISFLPEKLKNKKFFDKE